MRSARSQKLVTSGLGNKTKRKEIKKYGTAKMLGKAMTKPKAQR